MFLYQHDPSWSHLYPRCVFHALTGLRCPGCGAMRALYHLLHADISSAIRFNAFFVMFAPALLVAGAAEGAGIWNQRVVNAIRQPWVSWAVVVAIISWGVLRNTPLLNL
ncbi:MAG: DUF2752 domain-containing protein [Thermoanaerobaculia bacterium]